jgi:putative iron-dependent peroxidase
MVWNIYNISQTKEGFATVCKLVSNLNNSGKTRFPDGAVSIVMGIGHDAWKTLALPEPLPKELVNFEPIVGKKHTVVATKGDFHFHIRAKEHSFCIDAVAAIATVMNTFAKCAEEVHGFKYWDGRSILGFVDGTENPQGSKRVFLV